MARPGQQSVFLVSRLPHSTEGDGKGRMPRSVIRNGVGDRADDIVRSCIDLGLSFVGEGET